MLEEADTKGGKYGCDFSTSHDRKLPEDARRTTRNDERPSISYHFFPFSLSLSLPLGERRSPATIADDPEGGRLPRAGF